MKDYYVAIRRTDGKFAITARSASKNAHWKLDPIRGIVTHINDAGTNLDFTIVYDGMGGREAKRLKQFMCGALISSGYKMIPNGA